MGVADRGELGRTAAACLVLGSLAVFGFRIAHGDLPTETDAAALAYVAARPLYPVVHLGDWLGVLVWTAGLVALAGSLTHPTARAIGRLGAASALLGAAIHVTEFSVDGYALPVLAGQWAAAPAAERAGGALGHHPPLIRPGGAQGGLPGVAGLVRRGRRRPRRGAVRPPERHLRRRARVRGRHHRFAALDARPGPGGRPSARPWHTRHPRRQPMKPRITVLTLGVDDL